VDSRIVPGVHVGFGLLLPEFRDAVEDDAVSRHVAGTRSDR